MSMKKMLAVVAAAACVAFAAPAFAANPFMDIPMHHWAYDAVEQLAAHGVVEGYPDGTFKGNKPITRYEMSMMIARAMNKGGLAGEDADVLKRLIVEFKDELDNLGVKVDGFDKRIADLESGVGGWKFWGQLRIDYKSFDGDPFAADPNDTSEGINMTRYRIWMSKQVDENIKFVGRWNGGGAVFDRFYFDVDHFLFDTTLRAGKFGFDWEDDDGLYADSDAFVTDNVVQGFQLTKNFGIGEFTGLVGRLDDGDIAISDSEAYVYGARLKMAPSEKFWLSLNGLWLKPGRFNVAGNSASLAYYWAAAGFSFAEGFELKGAYFKQDLDVANMIIPGDDAKAWTAILSVDESVLKFTSLWIQYASFDRGFIAVNAPFDNYNFSVTPALNAVKNGGFGAANDVDVWFVKAEQSWGEKLSTFERFVKAKDGAGRGFDVTNWTVGVGYKYTPALYFELAYDDISYDGTAANPNPYGLADDHMIRFRTLLSF